MEHSTLLPRTSHILRRAELVGAFTYALDLTEGQPAGHALRACYIAMRVAQRLGLDSDGLGRVYYATLLKDLGCSSNAARVHELYANDDLALKRRFKTMGTGIPAGLGFVFGNVAAGQPLRRRAAAIAHILRNSDAIGHEVVATRCTRGSDIALRLGFGPDVARGIYSLDEHFDGSGRPGGLIGHAIPLESRLALLAQIVDVFFQHGGHEVATLEATRRAGTWLDPELVAVFVEVAKEPRFWRDLASPVIEAITTAMSPADECAVDEDFLDAISDAFGQVVDAKSPFTAGHSNRVASLTEALGARFDMLPTRLRQLRRAAALHDVGKLGVSSAILEKPGPLDAAEWEIMRGHAAHTHAILSRIGPLTELAQVAAAHHERIDGTGYPRGLADQAISRETRIITLCDIYDALTADRPYRAALPVEKALEIIAGEVGRSVDGECFKLLREMAA